MESMKISGHDHTVFTVGDAGGLKCDACDRSYCEGFSCSECKFTAHEQCIFLFESTAVFDHPSHRGHHLELLTTGAPEHTDPRCHICGKNTKRLLYHCSICNLNLDIDCMVDAMCAKADTKKLWHHHPLLEIVFGGFMACEICRSGGDIGYFCPRCRLLVHRKCVSKLDSKEITHSCHVRHSLKLLIKGAPAYTDLKCHLCGVNTGNILFHCDICKFNLDINCAVKKPPPVALSDLKVHEHTVTLMPRLVSFVCDACGTKGDRSPYVCFQCDFIIHQECARLPRVIHVNRHDHRVSYTYPLGPGEWKCGVCWEDIDWSCGAYTCSTCPHYAIHSRCATRYDVWDTIELDGVPEQVGDNKPFVVNDDNTITHFAHQEHNMSLNKEGGIAYKESISCGACVRPIGLNSFYKCCDCEFILHETCANFPQYKRHYFSPRPLALEYITTGLQECGACSRYCCSGFMYADYLGKFDLECSFLTEPFIHGCHPHPLLYMEENRFCCKLKKICQICRIRTKRVLGCNKCDFFLDFRCATLPLTVRLHRYDDHPLTLCYGEKEKASGKYWCDICEKETNPETWFYTCKDCGVTLHIFCVLGDLKYAKAGEKITEEVRLVANNTSSRPLCNKCLCRCLSPLFLKDYEHTNTFFCSYHCFEHRSSLH